MMLREKLQVIATGIGVAVAALVPTGVVSDQMAPTTEVVVAGGTGFDWNGTRPR